MDELHGLNVKPLNGRRSLHLKLPRRGSARSLARPVRLDLLGAAPRSLLGKQRGYDFAHQGYGYRLGPILPSRESDSPGKNMAVAVLLVFVQVRFSIGGIVPISGRAEMKYRL